MYSIKNKSWFCRRQDQYIERIAMVTRDWEVSLSVSSVTGKLGSFLNKRPHGAVLNPVVSMINILVVSAV